MLKPRAIKGKDSGRKKRNQRRIRIFMTKMCPQCRRKEADHRTFLTSTRLYYRQKIGCVLKSRQRSRPATDFTFSHG